MNILLQQFNDYMNNTDLKTVFARCLIIGGVLILVGILDRIQNSDLENKTFSRIALTMASIVLIVGVSALVYTKLPGYVEKAKDVDYLDNNGVFGTGKGSIAMPTPTPEPPTYVEPKKGETKSVIDDDSARSWARLDDRKEPTPPNMEPNDDPGPGPNDNTSEVNMTLPANLSTSKSSNREFRK